MTAVPTVRVANPAEPGSYMIINESDFVEGAHELWAEPGEAAGEPVAASGQAVRRAPSQAIRR